MTPKGKSPIDKKKGVFNSGSHPNSIEAKITMGKWVLPGKTKAETVKAYREWQKNFRINQTHMEKWAHMNVHDRNRHADTS